MELLEAIKTRRSVREFTSQRIPDEHIEMILDAARYAPSPENLQMWRYVVIREDQEMKDLIASARHVRCWLRKSRTGILESRQEKASMIIEKQAQDTVQSDYGRECEF
jgi:nitroreductase